MKLGFLLHEIGVGLFRHKLRSFLVFSTFALGFGSVLVTLGSVEGGRRAILGTLESLGPDIVAITVPRESFLALLLGTGSENIAGSDVSALADLLGDRVRGVLPIGMGLAQIEDGAESRSVTVVSAPPEFFSMIPLEMLAGVPYSTRRSVDPAAPKAEPILEIVLDEALARELVSTEAPDLVGTELRVNLQGRDVPVRVAGVLRDPIVLRKHLEVFDVTAKARSVSARRLEFRNLYVPRQKDAGAPTVILLRLSSLDEHNVVMATIADYFDRSDRHPIIFSQRAWIGAVQGYVNRFSVLAHFSWILNLCVVLILTGTIAGLAIEERFRELAIRRVEGATLRQVLAPIVGEGCVLAALAIPAGYLLSLWILEHYVVPVLGWPPVIPGHVWIWLPPALVAVGCATYWIPGRRVARKTPISVLTRHG